MSITQALQAGYAVETNGARISLWQETGLYRCDLLATHETVYAFMWSTLAHMLKVAYGVDVARDCTFVRLLCA